MSVEVTVENKFKKSPRQLVVDQYSDGSKVGESKTINHPNSATFSWDTVSGSDDYLEIRVNNENSELGKCKIDSPAHFLHEIKDGGAEVDVNITYSNGRKIVKVPAGNPTWKLKLVPKDKKPVKENVTVGDDDPGGIGLTLPGKPEPFNVSSPEVSHAVIEIFGGDNNLSDYVIEDMQEMAAGMQGTFSVLALADYIDKGAYVIEVSSASGIRVLEPWGEIDTGDPDTLAEFLARALVTYSPQTRKAIGFWDHGSGIFQESDPNETILERRLRALPRYRRSRSIPFRRLFINRGMLSSNPRARAMLGDDTNGGILTNREARGVIKAAFERSKHPEPVDLIFSDTCLNGMIEVLEQFKEFAMVVVGSEDLEPGDGWDYHEWLRLMSQQPPRGADEWASQAIEAYENGYKDLLDAHPCTLGAFRTEQDITEKFKHLIEVCDRQGQEGFAWLREARYYAQAFAYRDTYDIRDFAEKLTIIAGDNDIKSACKDITAAFDQARVHSVALGDEVKDSHGLAFWFPNGKKAYRDVVDTYKYLEFNKNTGWAGYLEKQFSRFG